MQSTSILILMLAAFATAAPSQSSEQQSNSGEYSINHDDYHEVYTMEPPKAELSIVLVANDCDDTIENHLLTPPEFLNYNNGDDDLVSIQSGPQQQNAPVVGQSPVVQPSVHQGVAEAGSPQVAPQVTGYDQPPHHVHHGSPQSGYEQPPHHVHHASPQSVGYEQHVHHAGSPVASYYAPSGLITVVGSEQQQAGVNKPVVGAVRNFEQYGQPESASIPPNYKPFGSWGLYIGGNPADGYYTNYYKSLSNSVEKQQAGDQVKPVVGQTAAFSPLLKQAGSSPYVGGDYYPFAYSPSELSSGVRSVAVDTPVAHSPVVSSVSPVQAGAQVYGAPASFETNYAVSPYADSYATKKVGAAYAQKEVQTGSPKGYQSRVYVYPPAVAASPAVVNSQSAPVQHQQQVVAYPVPVASQIVGSQPGVDGAFNPYGIHAFTRYAVKPTVVSQEPATYYYSTVHGQSQQQVPAYKPQQAYYSPGQSAYYPLSFYGYPLNQLHYSQGSIVPSSHGDHHHSPITVGQVDGAVEKPEKDDKLVVNQQQKRA